MNQRPLVWVIIGVSGAGKSVVGRLLSERLESDFLEGDRRHPVSNVIKMISQSPLDDEDRRRWLAELEADIRRAVAGKIETVLTCSALKSSYRRQLRSPGWVQLVYLEVPKSELLRRLKQRSNHYMKPEMLESQIQAFEPVSVDENVITVDGNQRPEEIVEAIMGRAIQLCPGMKKPWWQRYIE